MEYTWLGLGVYGPLAAMISARALSESLEYGAGGDFDRTTLTLRATESTLTVSVMQHNSHSVCRR